MKNDVSEGNFNPIILTINRSLANFYDKNVVFIKANMNSVTATYGNQPKHICFYKYKTK